MQAEELKELVENNFKFLTSMTTEEYTLYRKWIELNAMNWKPKELQLIQEIKSNIWQPKTPDDYKNLNIKVVYADTPDKLLIWRILRVFTSTAMWSQNPGRNLRFYVVHEDIGGNDPFGFGFTQPVHKYLGVISLGSDFIAIGGRDLAIGWNSDDKMKRGRLRHTAMGSSIVPTQPLGFNYLGGKLVSLMVISDVIENVWNEKYKDKLAGVTTTSLYGGFSQYNNLSYWKKCKSSEGQIALEPSDETYEEIKEYCKSVYPKEYESFVSPKNSGSGCSIPSHPKTKIMQKVFGGLKIKVPKNNMPRGVYWAPLYNNTNEFLKCETEELGEKKFDNSVKALSDLWKERYAKKRIESLERDGRMSSESLFYDDIVGMTWEECKDKYLKQVGR
jgi:hypothetical protein